MDPICRVLSNTVTNANETINSVFKAHVNYKPSQLMEFVEKLKELIDEQVVTN